MQRWDLSRGTLLFQEGDEGYTCFVVIRGVVDISVKVRGQPQLLAQLAPGSIFGQASLIDGEPRSVSCSIRRDAILAEIDAAACERLLNNRSRLALKLLAALNQGLVAALRSADRQLMRLNDERDGLWNGAGLRDDFEAADDLTAVRLVIDVQRLVHDIVHLAAPAGERMRRNAHLNAAEASDRAGGTGVQHTTVDIDGRIERRCVTSPIAHVRAALEPETAVRTHAQPQRRHGDAGANEGLCWYA